MLLSSYSFLSLSPYHLSCSSKNVYNQSMRCVYFLVTFVAITLTSKEKNSIFYTAKILSMLNPFSTNAPLMDKPGSWFLPVKCFKHFASKNQLHSGTLVENGLMSASLTHVFPLHLFTNP